MTELQAAPWIVCPRDLAAEERLRKELGVSSLVAAILAQRGFIDPSEADKFLHPRLEDLHDPRLLPDYEPARNEILGARERKERIFVHGDYDVDGVTSASILDRFLKKIGCDVITHVPHRMREGYGIHASAVEAAVATGAKLFLTCDCGISAFEQVAAAREAGLRVVVTDHHTVHEELPEAHAVINPHRPDSVYPWPELSGAGVVLKLCAGLTTEVGWKTEQFYRAYLDLAALGTIADVMPLLDENRIIARHGLERLTDSRKVGIQALKRVSEIEGPVTAYHVGFRLGPRINAAGRIDDAALALELLLETDETRAAKLAQQIDAINTERRAEQERIIQEAILMVTEKGQDKNNVIFVGHQSWHAGVVGIVAGRLVEVFRRPAFVATLGDDGKTGKASARSIPKFNLAQALQSLDPLVSGGGHAMAAGCSFEYDDMDRIAEALHEYAAEFLTEEDFKVTQFADLEVDASEITYEAVEQLRDLEPFGAANPEPIFVARDITFTQIKPTRSPQHMMLTMRNGTGKPIQGAGFGIGERLALLESGAEAHVLFRPCLDEWQGRTSLKWHVRDFALA
ncbi:MAG TPA: single-stranded-DNA-specific exonuclease RecJ [Fimbriimonadaceae bacterium]|nr:single-stranded-DNA-specific exonuclease RecJ [Fimbriimonadaceae bacterium]